MPKIMCECQEQIWLGEIPSPHQWLFVSDVEYERFGGMVDADEVYRTMRLAVLCPRCKRIFLYCNGWGNKPKIYQLEHDPDEARGRPE